MDKAFVLSTTVQIRRPLKKNLFVFSLGAKHLVFRLRLKEIAPQFEVLLRSVF
jgi:hypothetical protein